MQTKLNPTTRASQRGELQLWLLATPVVLVVLGLGFWFLFVAPQQRGHVVVAYCAQDQEYAEPIFQQFQKATGIRVRAVFDNEAVKTTGLANRLVTEQSHPQCDVFWGNEEMRTRQLAALGVFRSTNGWAAFGYRSRRVVINTNKLAASAIPHSLLELTNAAWSNKVALAYPQFGTTAAHLNALRQFWGDSAWTAWCRGLQANHVLLEDGNSMVVKTVGRGDAVIGISDSDDVAAGQREGLPVTAGPLTKELLLIPNTVGVVQHAPHPEAAQRLFDYLQQPEVVDRLVAAGALEGRDPHSVSTATLRVDWTALLRDLEPATKTLNQVFLR